MKRIHKQTYVPYSYRHAPVPGGGFVTGFCFHPGKPDILYARTDIGGVYRYDFTERSWISLMNHVKATQKWESYTLSIALNPAHPEWLYCAAGDWNSNYLCLSKDMGKHFTYAAIPTGVHGNAPGRGTGERLVVDPANSDIIYFGSQSGGLLVSEDGGQNFSRLSVKPGGGRAESDFAFVWLDPRSARNGRCQTMVAAASGKENSPGGNIRGCSLYISRDAGKTFDPLPGQPADESFGDYPGFVGQRVAFTGKYLFITMAAVKKSRSGWSGYACDSGGDEQGCILRYELTQDGDIKNYTYVTPDLSFLDENVDKISKITGFGGIDADLCHPGHLICSTQCCSQGDAVFYTTDYGEHWFPILHDLEIGIMDFDVPYMKPEYNNNHNLIHWLSDIKIDPYNPDRAVFNTGTGIFMTENLKDGILGRPVVWKSSCRGLEETVHLNVYSPPEGEVKLIDIVGDLGGFAFTDLTRPAENSFADQNKHRYITCLNADFPDTQPQNVAVTARGNWKGKTTGGVIWSQDQCRSWVRLPDPVNITGRIDQLVETIRKPNTNSGWVAVSANAGTLVWCIADKFRVPYDSVVYTENLGQSWAKSSVYDQNRQEYHRQEGNLKVFSDRMDSEVFYGFGSDSDIFISTDRARSFYQIAVPDDFPKLELGGIDNRMGAEIRVQSGKQGVVWIAAGEGGLWQISFHKKNQCADFKRISKEGDAIFCQGMGKASPGSVYDTLYVNGIIDGEYGFYRSLDEGRTWQRINHENQMFGDIRSIIGDPRTFGRFYIATGSRGVLWGMPQEQQKIEIN